MTSIRHSNSKYVKKNYGIYHHSGADNNHIYNLLNRQTYLYVPEGVEVILQASNRLHSKINIHSFKLYWGKHIQ